MSRRVLRGFDPEALKAAREKRKITVQDLARCAGVTYTTVWTWENGKHAPNIDTLVKVAAYLEIPVARLVSIPKGTETLGDLRVLAGLTQPQLAKAAGMTTTVLSKLERGETPITDTRAEALAPRLGVSANEVSAAWQRARDRPPGAPA